MAFLSEISLDLLNFGETVSSRYLFFADKARLKIALFVTETRVKRSILLSLCNLMKQLFHESREVDTSRSDARKRRGKKLFTTFTPHVILSSEKFSFSPSTFSRKWRSLNIAHRTFFRKLRRKKSWQNDPRKKVWKESKNMCYPRIRLPYLEVSDACTGCLYHMCFQEN